MSVLCCFSRCRIDAVNTEAQWTAASAAASGFAVGVGCVVLPFCTAFERFAARQTALASAALQLVVGGAFAATVHYGCRAIRNAIVDEGWVRPPKFGVFLPFACLETDFSAVLPKKRKTAV